MITFWREVFKNSYHFNCFFRIKTIFPFISSHFKLNKIGKVCKSQTIFYFARTRKYTTKTFHNQWGWLFCPAISSDFNYFWKWLLFVSPLIVKYKLNFIFILLPHRITISIYHYAVFYSFSIVVCYGSFNYPYFLFLKLLFALLYRSHYWTSRK